MSKNGATLFAFRDLDLLLKLEHEADTDGYLETAAIAESMGLDGALSITSRLSWMRRYGMLAFDGNRHMWRVTDGARRVVEARLRAAHSKELESLPDEQMVNVMSHVVQRYLHGDPMMGHMLRREFIFGTGRR